MQEHSFTIYPAVFIFLIRDGKIFLFRRSNTGWADGLYSTPTGHVDAGETPTQAAIREAKEESGVDIAPEKIKLVHVGYRAVYPGSDRHYVYFCFLAESWSNEPYSAEPDKSDHSGWFDLNNLPETLPFMDQMFKNYQAGIFYSELGF